MITYSRKVFFYETDAQGIVHHSNYPRYFEEARGYFLEKNGYPYEVIRSKYKLDVVLTGLEIKYKKFLEFGDTFYINLKPKKENRYFFSFYYEVFNQKKQLICNGKTSHCFIRTENRKITSIPEFISNIIL